MGHLLYLMFRCDRGCDGKFGKFGSFVGTKHTCVRFHLQVLMCSDRVSNDARDQRKRIFLETIEEMLIKEHETSVDWWWTTSVLVLN